MELKDRIALVIGAGQSPGQGVGNGRATVMRFAEEGAHVVAVDRELALAQETVSLTEKFPGRCTALEADVVSEEQIKAAVDTTLGQHGRIDILHYNVGISVAGGDASAENITNDAVALINAVNLRGAVMAVKHVLPAMQRQKNGVILTIASISAYQRYPWVTYKTTKAGLVAFTQQIAIEQAAHGIRANTILPGLMDTPMAVDTRARAFGRPREEIAAERDANVPLRGKMGTGWDVANAAVFLASDKAQFITGVELPVDGGALLNIVREIGAACRTPVRHPSSLISVSADSLPLEGWRTFSIRACYQKTGLPRVILPVLQEIISKPPARVTRDSN